MKSPNLLFITGIFILVILALFTTPLHTKQQCNEMRVELFKAQRNVDYYRHHYRRRVGEYDGKFLNIISVDHGRRWIVIEGQTRDMLGYLHELYPQANPVEDFIAEYK